MCERVCRRGHSEKEKSLEDPKQHGKEQKDTQFESENTYKSRSYVQQKPYLT